MTPVAPELILKCRNATPNSDGTCWFGQLTLADNSEALIVVRDDEAAQVTSLHGWRPLLAKWVNPKLLYLWRDVTEHHGYCCLYDVEQKTVLLEEDLDDGVNIWSVLSEGAATNK
jgi:hypothetical protein